MSKPKRSRFMGRPRTGGRGDLRWAQEKEYPGVLEKNARSKKKKSDKRKEQGAEKEAQC